MAGRASSNAYIGDRLTSLAKKQGFVARSIFKLEDLDVKFKIFKKGQTVMDLGCAPGSWLQYMSKQVGWEGRVVGIDLKSIEPELFEQLESPVKTLQEDVMAWQPPDILKGRFDVVASDMAPSTCGHKAIDAEVSAMLSKRALEIAHILLKPEGWFVVKIFQGKPFIRYEKILRAGFTKTNAFKPPSCRSGSVETYLVARGPRPVLKDLLENFEEIDVSKLKKGS